MIFLLFLAFIAFLTIIWSTLTYGIGPTPTSKKVRTALFQAMPEEIKGKIYELGAGFGSLAFPLADKYPEAEIIAIEISPIPWFWMYLKLFFAPRKNLYLVWGNFYKESLRDARVIVCYLYPGAMEKVSRKVRAECHDTWLFTHTFALPRIKPEIQTTAQDLYHTRIYGYYFNP